MKFLFSSDLVNSSEPAEFKACALCGESPKVAYVCENPVSLYCPVCGADATGDEFSEVICAWNRANSDKADFEKYFFYEKNTEVSA